MADASDVTQQLLASTAGEPGALDRLMPLLYDERAARAIEGLTAP